MSNNRGGFFSLNRLLGRKQKVDKHSSFNGFPKTSVQTLTRSSTNLEDISPQNKITPLTTVHNAPFEQTFRITVYLPMNQLYVSRIGAKTKLCELLDIICMNKLLDSNKFEFRHPADDNQIFDLNFTIGEVGLSEIKLAHKNGKEDTIVRYRINTSGHENRSRPHTMSTVSPYSSTNSLNSSDSMGIVINHRLSNGHVPAVPGRKKRIAPRPPSQNSISEDPERKTIMERSNSQIDQTGLNRSSLNRQHFHVSSPNLSMNNNATLKSYFSTDTSISNSLDGRQVIINDKKAVSSRPLSVQPRNSTIEINEPKYRRSESINSIGNQSHSRTSSETSDITRDSFPEPQPRKRFPPTGKKKAPAPPPRTVSSHNGPIATPRCLQKLSEEEMKDENGNIESVNLENVQRTESKPIIAAPFKNPTNVSKIMLNVNETETETISTQNTKTDNDIQNVVNYGVSACDENLRNSGIQDKYTSDGKIVDGKSNKTKPKKISVVNFSISCIEHDIDPNDISKQVNDIIDEAVKINEAMLNAKNERKNEEVITKTNEMNNNNKSKFGQTMSEKEPSSQSKIHSITNSNPESGKTIAKRNISPEVPIQPILNEVRTFDFQEYSDNSLPASSTTSTLNTTETPSAGPDSLITSDIEDGYKGNEVEKKRRTETTYEESKEDFIESQFGFLSEHLDSKTNVDSDDEKTIESIKTHNIVSSTMINDKFGETFKVSPTVEKRDVIDELTQIINCNRLETFMKPSNDTNKLIEVGKRSSLTNFHIGAYSNSSNEKNRTADITCATDISTNIDKIPEQQKTTKDPNVTQDDSLKIPKISDDTEKNSETFVPKPVGRSMSFHSTFAGFIDREDNQNNTNMAIDLSGARSFSYISLNDISKDENYNHRTTTAIMSEFNESTRKKSASELSIADTPSLQSIEIMKSILNNSRSMNLDCTSETDRKITEQDNQRNSHEREDKLQNDADSSSKSINEPKTWKYQGPPSINVSTWGDRPKSLVHIKSDNDYIFGGSSKISALQKRFSGLNEQQNHTSGKPFQNQTEHCNSNSCKLPVVRSVEYKKNIPVTSENTQDSLQRPFRSSYEVSRIISQKTLQEKMRTPYATTTLNRNKNANYSSDPVPGKSILKYSLANRVESADGHPEMQSPDQLEMEAKNDRTKGVQRVKDKETEFPVKCSIKTIEKPMFSQLTLRKTGLKEKILDERNECHVTKGLGNHNDCSKNTTIASKANEIPTAPKPPPMPIKPSKRLPSTGDPRADLLNSIRKFNRDALKRNCIY
ncbi:probable serine/threonine-protein kinase DDB_G0282963 [Sitodiplosis mosellana]|uniref:probable serine/threonine-protein kinase DDB_G0282963 n=1 Tax=Sitodiplosis mosellana TaxID=263140 RepID=UPI002444D523|nr:probable serine/threonine-protein kinase DDB_G0282963 [Sitodiplosis mosellana]XP_055305479.1 probable serine/threonine-protein kinase DDB_G0282963 [Sitodiplosis mosellana]XP_055305480.1 probable serine/threonine-protein kinase DDB_G0282963 [Sitodiplosis mosellana]XP_055305481.1 probable serine/threonine-protein kinase DDB_G0282963 [Sitodiplosis mosellana]XP_055305483.1 probable serine/threonine-protein kinase DDB_G0282963 [Sitodiplosis mosellana]XP_055305484.1 probable serine/threonine-prot